LNSFILMNSNRKKENLKQLTHLKFGRNLIEQLYGEVRKPDTRKCGHRGKSIKDV